MSESLDETEKRLKWLERRTYFERKKSEVMGYVRPEPDFDSDPEEEFNQWLAEYQEEQQQREQQTRKWREEMRQTQDQRQEREEAEERKHQERLAQIDRNRVKDKQEKEDLLRRFAELERKVDIIYKRLEESNE